MKDAVPVRHQKEDIKYEDYLDRGTRRSDVQIVLAEDSALLHKLISDSLKK